MADKKNYKNFKEDREFTIEDAVLAAELYSKSKVESKTSSGYLDVKCPTSDKRDSFKVRLYKDHFWCSKCGTGGGPVSLFMHLVQASQSSTEAARTMHELLDGDDVEVKTTRPKLEVPTELPPERPIADILIRDRTYRVLLTLLTLSEAHRENLRSRGFTDAQIEAIGFRSLPKNPDVICKKLLNAGCILDDVPGFYKKENGSWTMNVKGSGYFVPFCNGLGQIQFMQIRTDKKAGDKGGSRYFAFSSRKMETGAPAHAWAHIAIGNDGIKEIFITEGALKADAASCLSGKSFLAVPGVGNTMYLPKALKDLKVKGMEKAYLCYDMDEIPNKGAEDGEARIIKMLSTLRVPYQKVTWSDVKGIDDWLLANIKKEEGGSSK